MKRDVLKCSPCQIICRNIQYDRILSITLLFLDKSYSAQILPYTHNEKTSSLSLTEVNAYSHLLLMYITN